MPSTTGSHVRAAYKYESSYAGSVEDSDFKIFGGNQTIDTLTLSNNPSRVYDTNEAVASQVNEQQLEGAFSVSFEYENPWWLRAIFGAASTSGSGPTTYTFDSPVPDSFRLYINETNNSFERQLKGCVVQTATITFELDEPVRVTLDGFYADESKPGSPDLSSTPGQALEDRVLGFEESDLTLDVGGSGTRQERVQTAELTIALNTRPTGELGDRKAVDYAYGPIEHDLSRTEILDSDTEVDRAYGDDTTDPTSPQSTVDNGFQVDIESTNGLTGTDKNLFRVEATGAVPSELDVTGLDDVEADVESAITEWATGLTAVAEVEEAAAP